MLFGFVQIETTSDQRDHFSKVKVKLRVKTKRSMFKVDVKFTVRPTLRLRSMSRLKVMSRSM